MYIEKGLEKRQIVMADGSKEYLSKNAMCYDDDTWRVKLYSGKDLGLEHQNVTENVAITLRPRFKEANTSKQSTRMIFSSGKLELSIGKHESMTVHCSEYDEMLDSCFGIFDGHVLNDPNRTWEPAPDPDQWFFRVVSNGEAKCTVDGKAVELGLDDEISLNETRATYEVSGATWAVVCIKTLDKPDFIQLWTLEPNIDRIAEQLETFINEREQVVRFDDYFDLLRSKS